MFGDDWSDWYVHIRWVHLLNNNTFTLTTCQHVTSKWLFVQCLFSNVLIKCTRTADALQWIYLYYFMVNAMLVFLSGLEYLNNVSATHNAFVWQRKRINSEHKHTNALEWIDVIDIDLIWHALPNMQMAYQLKLNQFSKLRLFCEWICYIHVFVYGYGYNNINSI